MSDNKRNINLHSTPLVCKAGLKAFLHYCRLLNNMLFFVYVEIEKPDSKLRY